MCGIAGWGGGKQKTSSSSWEEIWRNILWIMNFWYQRLAFNKVSVLVVAPWIKWRDWEGRCNNWRGPIILWMPTSFQSAWTSVRPFHSHKHRPTSAAVIGSFLLKLHNRDVECAEFDVVISANVPTSIVLVASTKSKAKGKSSHIRITELMASRKSGRLTLK